MITAIVILSIFSVVLLALLLVSLYFNYKHGIILLQVVDRIEESLDILDERYASISEILKIPLFFDSPQVRAVLEDIKICRDAILRVANLIGKVEEQPQEALDAQKEN